MNGRIRKEMQHDLNLCETQVKEFLDRATLGSCEAEIQNGLIARISIELK